MRFGISPFAVWRNRATDPLGSDTRAGVQTYDDLYADTRRWVREGWIDYIVPQVYWNIGFAAADYAKLVPWWAEAVRGTGVDLYIGEALYKAGDPAQPARLAGPGGTVPPPHPVRRTTARCGERLLLGEGSGRPTATARWRAWSPTTIRAGYVRPAEPAPRPRR